MKSVSGRIEEIRRRTGSRLLVLGHHYQRSEVLAHADRIGDSLELARHAASCDVADRIVFCGVRFMAESADILTRRDQDVYMPDPSAGCPLADRADLAAVTHAWEEIDSYGGNWLPVVYVNSTSGIKAWCGRNGGSACTSGNAREVFKWVFDRGCRVFFVPDRHLGRNTAAALGLEADDTAVYDPAREHGGVSVREMKNVRVMLWDGYCHVHTAFNAGHIETARRNDPDAVVIVHPEVPYETARLADERGSTARMIDYVRALAPGSIVYVGTELHLVDRLAEEQRGRVMVKPLARSECFNMGLTGEDNLLNLLETWASDKEIHVAPETAADAKIALDRMLDLS